MKNVTEELYRTIIETYDQLIKIPESDSQIPLGPDKWSRKQILGHLIDSASNNHQRFIRAQLINGVSFPAYEQNSWVVCQNYQDESWSDLLSLWRSYNLHLAHMIPAIKEEILNNQCRIGDGEPVTLRFLIVDYLRHLKHHIAQILS